MRPLLHASLVNGRFGDPGLWIETLFERRAILLDLGDIAALPPRKIHRLEHVFVSHTHVDHFIGFDRLLRVLVGREKTVKLYGPQGFIDQLRHKLNGYSWNLASSYGCDLAFLVTEVDASLKTRAALFRLKSGFKQEAAPAAAAEDGVICKESTFHVRTAALAHGGISCLAFTVQEAAHVNVWKNRLAEQELPVGPWLKSLKRAVIEDRPDDYPIRLDGRAAATELPLGGLRRLVTVTQGQKIAYVTDAEDSSGNRKAIIDLIQGADLLFIEAAFAEADLLQARERGHLTTRAAGEIAREAGVRRVEAFHFSPRYEGEEQRMLDEVQDAFAGR
ncbi:MAG TPA: MBL fold metallo-hydrolase [Alphaproteobacteria bacterium]|nr:MBL fold metallo-hydrolase [Alphaproteobacteria bacterium]